MSITARVVRIWVRSSSGRVEIGQGGCGENSVGGSMGSMRRALKESMRDEVLPPLPLPLPLPLPGRDAWAVPGIVSVLLDGLVSVGLGLTKEEGGKCFFL